MAVLDFCRRCNKVYDSIPFPRLHLMIVSVLLSCFVVVFFLPSDDAAAVRLSETINVPLAVDLPLSETTLPPKASPRSAQLPDSATGNIRESTIFTAATDDTHLVSTITSTSDNSMQGNNSALQTDGILQAKEITVQAGDNLSKIFARAGLNDRNMFELIEGHTQAKTLVRLFPGHTLVFEIDDTNILHTLTHRESRLISQTFARSESGFEHTSNQKKPDIKLALRSGVIRTSLYMAGRKAMIEDKLIMELANIFGWDIDFALDIRENDHFKLLFEEKFLDGDKLGTGKILAAEFTNQNKAYTAVRYVDDKGNAQYFAPNGNTMRKEFLRTPIEFARISSHFNLRRKHPVLNRIRAHKGTDYAAPPGTPIRATGDGKVIFTGRKGSYGKTVVIQHGQAYRTLYAHMNNYRKGIRTGARVKQGQTIGYVGATGLVTGPHLHYEFYFNGAVRNPVTVKLPKAKALASKEKARFSEQVSPLLKQLAAPTFQPYTNVAMNEEQNTP